MSVGSHCKANGSRGGSRRTHYGQEREEGKERKEREKRKEEGEGGDGTACIDAGTGCCRRNAQRKEVKEKERGMR